MNNFSTFKLLGHAIFCVLFITKITGKPLQKIVAECSSHPNYQMFYFNNCTHYFQCIDGVKVLQQCPDGLLWSQVFQTCELPVFARCHPDDSEDLNGNIDFVNLGFNEQSNLSPGEDCKHYYMLHNQTLHRFECPQMLVWNAESQRCDFPAMAKCTPDKNVIQGIFANLRLAGCPNVKVNDNKRYYICQEGKSVILECPKGLKYSEVHQSCQYPKVANPIQETKRWLIQSLKRLRT